MTTKNEDYLYFKTHASLYQWVKDNNVDIDISKSMNGSRYTVNINGERKFNHNLPALIGTLNLHLPDEAKLDPSKSVAKGKLSYLCYLLGDKVAVKEEAVVEVVATTEEEVFEEVVEPATEEITTPDWEHVTSLKDEDNKSESKDALEAYARGFNVELAKNKKFDNMVADFKAAL